MRLEKNMLNKNISIQKEEVIFTYKDLIIIVLSSLLLSVVFYVSGIIKQNIFLITSLFFLISVVVHGIIMATIKDLCEKKQFNTLKQNLKKLHRLFIKMENSCNVNDYNIFKENVIKLIPNNTGEKQIIKSIAKRDCIGFSSSFIKTVSVFFEYGWIILLYILFAFCVALTNGNFGNFTLFSANENSIFVYIFIFTFAQKIIENNIENNKLFKIRNTDSLKRMCEKIIEILEENECNTKGNKTVKVRKICCKKHYNMQTRKNGVTTKKHY